MTSSIATTAMARPRATSACGLLRLTLALIALCWAGFAFPHAALLSSTPAQGALLSGAPSEIKLIFDEPVAPLLFKITAPDGRTEDLRQVRAIPGGLSLTLSKLTHQGTYALSWRVISADGHPIGSALIFSVGTTSKSASSAVTRPPARAFVIWLGLASWYISLILGVGFAGCFSLAASLRTHRPLGLGLLAAAGAMTAINVGLLGVDALDLPLAGLSKVQTWHVAINTTFGSSALAALCALICSAAAWLCRHLPTRRLLALLSLAFLGTTLAVSGHANTAPPIWLARAAVWLHVVAVTLWIGSLLPLIYTLGKSNRELRLLEGFSRAIPTALGVLLVSGGVLVYLEFDRPASLWSTAYGQVLLAKLSLVAGLLILGAYNRYRLTNAILTSKEHARRTMRRVIGAEGIVAIAVLAIVALWRFTPPPIAVDATAATAAQTITAHIHGPTATVDVAYLKPTHTGPSSLVLHLSGANLGPLTAKEVHVVFSRTSAGIEPITFTAKLAQDGTWQVHNIQLPAQDHWDLGIDLLISDFKRIRLETALQLPSNRLQMPPAGAGG